MATPAPSEIRDADFAGGDGFGWEAGFGGGLAAGLLFGDDADAFVAHAVTWMRMGWWVRWVGVNVVSRRTRRAGG